MKCFATRHTQYLRDPINSMSVGAKRHGSVVGIPVSYFESSGFDSGLDGHLARCFTELSQSSQTKARAVPSSTPPEFLPISFL